MSALERNVTAAPRSSGRVLVVDDEPRVARSIALALSDAFDVDVAHSGADALELVSQGERYDVILCDVMMPHMTGPELFERLRVVAPAMAEEMVFITGGALLPE